jgi:hypothetical protein
LLHNGFADLIDFNKFSEWYTLSTWFHLDPESKHTGSTAQLLIKPQLILHGHPTPVDILTDISATIVTTQFKVNSSNQTVSKTFRKSKTEAQRGSGGRLPSVTLPALGQGLPN